jgi:hypothetical protein
MLTAQAGISTARASRYVLQFCRHANHMAHHPGPRSSGEGPGSAPPEVRGVAWSDTLGVVRFASGCCVLQASPDTLLVSVDATGEDELQRLVAGITRRLVTIGRRDQLTVNWRRPDPVPGLAPGQPTGPTPLPTTRPTPDPLANRHRRFTSTLLVAGVVALAILVHLGLIGGALAASVWANWGVNLVLALVLIKVLVVGGHVVLGRFALRRAPALANTLRGIPWMRRRSSPGPIPSPEATGQAPSKRET